MTRAHLQIAMALVLMAVDLAAPLTSRLAYGAEGGTTVYTPGLYGDFGMADAGAEGFEVIGLLSYQSASASQAIKSGQSNTNLREQSLVFVPMVTYVTDYTIFGGRYFAGLRLALAGNRAMGDAGTGQPFQIERDYEVGLEDVYVYPLGLSWNVGDVDVTFFQGINVPIGTYHRDNLATISSHYWASDTNLAFTWVHPEKEYELSFNVGYLVNAQNTATKYRTGQGIHLDYLIGQHFSNELSIGLAGYMYRQVTGDSGSGALGGPFKLQANGLGPAVSYTFEMHDTDIRITAKWLRDFGVVNGLSGSHFFLEAGFQF